MKASFEFVLRLTSVSIPNNGLEWTETIITSAKFISHHMNTIKIWCKHSEFIGFHTYTIFEYTHLYLVEKK